MGIAFVDFGEFLSGDVNIKSDIGKPLGIAYDDDGFVAVKNYGISEELITKSYIKVQLFFIAY